MNQSHFSPDKDLAEIEAFEERYGYDAAYMKEMWRASPEAFAVFKAFLPMAGFRQAAAPEVYSTARITAFRQVDCGPCLQLAMRMAREAGIEESLLGEILDTQARLTPLLETVRAFATAVLDGTPDCNDLRKRLLADLGEAAVIELGLTIAAAQVFPAIKRVTGHYQSCSVYPLKI